MNEKDLVSVIMPVYNGEQFLKEAIDSVLNQTYKNIELIIVNDGSTDSTEKIILEYVEKDSRVKYLLVEHGGAGKARNRGIDKANGAFITFCDADDCFDKQFVEKNIEFLRVNDRFGLSYCNTVLIDDKGKKIGRLVQMLF